MGEPRRACGSVNRRCGKSNRWALEEGQRENGSAPERGGLKSRFGGIHIGLGNAALDEGVEREDPHIHKFCYLAQNLREMS